jgi:CheY-like chemotaxis protein/REP element-mobilizing transposase RayT
MITRLLLIDADISFIVTLKQALESTGQFRVNLAANGQAALEALLHSQYHAALVDLELADIDPYELVDLIHQARPDLPVIMMPGDEHGLNYAQMMNVQGALTKPFTARELIAYLRDLLESASAPVVAPPDGVERDEFVAPQMPPLVQAALSEPGAAVNERGRRPTELFSEEERIQLRQGLQDLEGFGAVVETSAGEEADALLSDADDMLTEAELFDRLGAVQPDRLQDDQSDDWETIAPQTVAPSAVEEPPPTRLLAWDEDQAPGTMSQLVWPEEPPPTRQFAAADEPPSTRLLEDDEEAEETRRLTETESLETRLAARAWPERGAPRDEPPVELGDTPAVPAHDLDSMRQFLATSYSAHDPSEFGDVLDAVARLSPDDYEFSPDDRAFHDLVDALRPHDAPQQRRTRLDELLASIAADSSEAEKLADSGATLDYVLDALRRAGPPAQPGEKQGDELAPDETTIGDVIDGLFEPSFEGVLAALAGEEVADEDYAEPAYSPFPGPSAEPAAADQIAPDALVEDDSPAWLTGLDLGVVPPPDRSALPEAPAEPPAMPQVPRHYPATTALAAVAEAEDGDDFSLAQLLGQIEEQLPAFPARRPSLKPLPSWDTDAGLGGERDLTAIFDELEGARPSPPWPSLEDTRPVSRPDARVAATDGLDLDLIFAAPQAAPSGEGAFPDELRDLAEAAQLAADAHISEANIAALFYAGVRQDASAEAWDFVEPAALEPPDRAYDEPGWAEPADEALPLAFDDSLDQGPEWAEPADEGSPRPSDLAAGDEPWLEPAQQETQPAWDRLSARAEQPAAEPVAAPLTAAEEDAAASEMAAAPPAQDEDAEEADIAQTAVDLTQYSLESSAQATMLSRPGRLLASAGDLPEEAIARLLRTVDAAWRTSPAASDALIRYIALPDAGEFLLYSTRVEANMTLSMVFGASTPLRTIRRQARRLSESLNLLPELPEAPAARTKPRRPEGFEARLDAVAEVEVQAESEPPPLSAASESDPGPYASYTCLWMPHDSRLELRGEFADSLGDWLEDAVGAERWRLEALDVQTDYVLLSVDVPQTMRPDQAIARLMAVTAQRSAEEFPDLAFGQPLWADGYYFVTPPRDLTDREITRFLALQRQS